jgi:hypothetical protein
MRQNKANIMIHALEERKACKKGLRLKNIYSVERCKELIEMRERVNKFRKFITVRVPNDPNHTQFTVPEGTDPQVIINKFLRSRKKK